MDAFARGLVWTTAPAEEVRRRARKAGAGQAVVIALESGTVLVPTDRTSISERGLWLNACRRAGGVAVGFVWSPARWAWIPPEAVTRFELLTRRNRAARLARAFGVAETVVEPYLQPPGNVVDSFTELLKTVGRPDVANVLRLAHEGVFDAYGRPGLRRYKIMSRVLGIVITMIAYLGIVPLHVLTELSDWVILPLVGVIAGAAPAVVPSLLMRLVRIDRLLPVVQLPASESQSAKYEANEPRTSSL